MSDTPKTDIAKKALADYLKVPVENTETVRASDMAKIERENTALCAEVERLREDGARLDKLASYLSEPSKHLAGPFLEDTSWQFGYNGGEAYVIEGSGSTLRAAIDSLPDAARAAEKGKTT